MSKISRSVFLLSMFVVIAVALPLFPNRRRFEQEILTKRSKRSRRDASCQDHHQCDKWLDFSDLYWSCNNNSRNRKKCPKSCKLCPTTTPQTTMSSTVLTTMTSTGKATDDEPCIDANPHCAQWAKDEQCTINPGYMLYNCAYSCGICASTSSTTLATGCFDSHSACPSWISTCSTNTHVQTLCRKTCNQCNTSPPTLTTTTATTPSTPSTPSTPTTHTTPTAPTRRTTQKKKTTPTTTNPTTATRSTESSTTTTIKLPSATTIISPYDTTTEVILPNQSTRFTTPWVISRVSTGPELSTKRQLNNRTTTAIPEIPSSSSGAANTEAFKTVQNIPSAGPRHVKSGLNKAVVGIIVSGIVVACVVVAVCLYKRRMGKRNPRMSTTPGNIITMQPSDYSKPHDTKRDSGIDDCDVYEDPSSSRINQAFYHVAEIPGKRTSTPQNLEPIYACASNGHEKESFEQDQSIIYDYSIPEGLVMSSLIPANLKPGNKLLKCADHVAMETPYYHVLENPDAVAPELSVIYESLIDGNAYQSAGETPSAQSRYQPIIKHEKSVYESLDKSNRIGK